MSPISSLDRATGIVLVLLSISVACAEWGLPATVPSAALTALILVLLALQVSARGRVFLAVGLALALANLALRPTADALDTLTRALTLAAFIAAFFTALATLREAADGSEAIRRCGRFLATQPPGRRYAALTVGGQLFSLVLNYGAIALLGSLATASAQSEANEEIRRIRVRRMLLAIQRGFISVLPWSPLSFAVAITTTLIPGASWSGAVLPALVTGALLAGIGYALDTALKPRLSGPRPVRAAPEGDWNTVLPLLSLLAILFVVVGSLALVVAVRVPGIVIVVVPIIAILWTELQAPQGARMGAVLDRVRHYTLETLPGYRGELTLLMMAGFIGTAGADLLLPAVEGAGLDLSGVPAALLLGAFVWLIPVAGQLGMNPILFVSLVAPLIPSAEALGVTPTAVMVAITAGWALSGASSPFTATTLLVGSFAGRSATFVGLVWNGAYSLICASALTVWVLAHAFL